MNLCPLPSFQWDFCFCQVQSRDAPRELQDLKKLCALAVIRRHKNEKKDIWFKSRGKDYCSWGQWIKQQPKLPKEVVSYLEHVLKNDWDDSDLEELCHM